LIPASSNAYINPAGIGDAAGVPKPAMAIADAQGRVTPSWWRFFNILDGPPQQEAPVILGSSPTTFVVPSDCQILIAGGTGVSLQYTRKGTYNLPTTIGYFPLSQGDALTITYSTAPTVVYFPC
jgi:hypothetical protein